MPRGMPAGLQPTLAGLVNADAASDEQARATVWRLFGSALFLLCVVDLACAAIVTTLQCDEVVDDDAGDNDGDDYDNDSAPSWLFLSSNSNSTTITTTSRCMRHAMMHPFATTTSSSSSSNNNDDDDDHVRAFGDLLWLAVARVVLTGLLLWVGLRWANPQRRLTAAVATTTTTTTTATSSSSSSQQDIVVENNAAATLTEPLLNAHDNHDDDDDQHQQQEETAATVESPSDGNDDDDQNTQENNETNRRVASCVPCGGGGGEPTKMVSPDRVKSLVLLVLFVTCTLYQVYTGLQVALFHDDEASQAVLCLLCLTVLWINGQAYLFRVLLAELTRAEALFLPPEIHRHGMYLIQGVSMPFHTCDLCHQRLEQPSSSGSNNNNNNNRNPGVYRCALCDFDVCMKCANRHDAAVVGENVLRGDRGVRVETALTTRDYFARSLQVARRELPLLLVSLALLAASSVSRLLLPHFQGHIIDKVIPNANGDYDKPGFLRFIQIYIVIMVLQGAVSTLYSAIFTLVSRRLKFTMRNTLLEKILNQDVAYFDGTESGRLISRLTYDLEMMMDPISSSLSSLLSNILILFGGLIMCFVKSYRLSMVAFVCVGPITYLWEQYAKWSKGLAREMLVQWADGNSIASQALAHVRTVKSFGCEDKVLEKYTQANQRALDCGVKDAWGNGFTSALTGYLDLGCGVLILYFGGLLVYRGEMSVGALVTFQLFWNMMNNSAQSLQGLVTSFTRSAAGAEKCFSLWDSEPDIDPKKGSDIDWDVKGHLKFHDVTYYYNMRPDNIVLKSFNLEIPAGKSVALVGRSGGGKSTICNLLLRFYDPKEGHVELDGKKYDSLKVHQLRRLFGVVAQETELFALTVEENISYGMDKDEYTMDDVINAAKKACAHDFISEMKDGYQTRIGERGNRLSGGQRQRLAIARVFLRRPKIILLDEATSNLDEHSQEAVQQALANLIAESNATVLLVAHRLSTVQNADAICVIDKGQVLEQGNHEELLALSGVYASMVEKQMKKKAELLDQEKDNGDNKAETRKNATDDIDALLDEN